MKKINFKLILLSFFVLALLLVVGNTSYTLLTNSFIDNVKVNLSNFSETEDMINVFGGALLFFEDALSNAENLDNKLSIDYVNYFYREIGE